MLIYSTCRPAWCIITMLIYSTSTCNPACPISWQCQKYLSALVAMTNCLYCNILLLSSLPAVISLAATHTTLVSKLYARNSQERQNTAKQSRINTAQHNRVYSTEKSSSEIRLKNWTARSLCNIGTLFRAQKTTTHHHDAKRGRALHISAMHRPHEQSYAHCRAQDSISLHCTLLCFWSPQSKEFHAALDWPGLIPVTLPESLIGRWPLQGKN